ncbi:RNA polymerase sigma factor, sigma-70 family [Sulfobacillus thermosulfidooxidans DSM 9293]|uniref:RNA polymerase sigma factor, sigma-70 family n=1 Tax=Sulfobacillus thermosulfidooxidans (strain DSM 9293 / VKM B-1269 / AT-1) TaxID=929705 RepID=A0A1W1WI96_SULTA|nr:sigma-70 family RNA polymerase sigma factor [Sulfobacillus thermosulfidooxidans]SMC05869.1 RNA polymerase sigma factor, sigma-70 family [Sulfobacillus thermosulfidooxidans DSM 9293]
MDDWDEWCTAIDSSIRRYCQNRVPEQDVEDVVQEIWLKFFDRPREHVNAIWVQGNHGYVMGIAKHVVADYWRRQKSVDIVADRPAFSSGHDVVEDKEFEQEIRLLIKQLPKTLQGIIQDRLFVEATLEDLARVYHLPVGTVKSRLHQARHLLQRRLLALPHDDGPLLFPDPYRIVLGREKALWQWLKAGEFDIRMTWTVRVEPLGSIWLDVHVAMTQMRSLSPLSMRWTDLGWPRRLVSNTALRRFVSTDGSIHRGYQLSDVTHPTHINLSFFLSPQKARRLHMLSITRSGFHVAFETIPVSSPPSHLRMTSKMALVLPARWHVKTPARQPEQHLVVNDRQYLLYQMADPAKLFRMACDTHI